MTANDSHYQFLRLNQSLKTFSEASEDMTLNNLAQEMTTDEIGANEISQDEADQPGQTDASHPIEAALLQQYSSRRATRRNRRRGFTPTRRGRPIRTISGGSR
ncbi:MAG: hypothetical protein WBA76_14140 [Phormidesmis sp.]